MCNKLQNNLDISHAHEFRWNAYFPVVKCRGWGEERVTEWGIKINIRDTGLSVIFGSNQNALCFADLTLAEWGASSSVGLRIAKELIKNFNHVCPKSKKVFLKSNRTHQKRNKLNHQRQRFLKFSWSHCYVYILPLMKFHILLFYASM